MAPRRSRLALVLVLGLLAAVAFWPTTTPKPADPAASPPATPPSERVDPATGGAPAPAAGAGRTEVAPVPTTTPTPPSATTGDLLVQVVTGGDEQPLAGIHVAVQEERSLPDPAFIADFRQSDERGEVRFPGLRPGRHFVDVDRLGRAAIATVKAGTTTTRKVRLQGGLRVEGEVVDPSGAPVPGARVLLHASRVGAQQVAVADDQGRFAVAHLVPGVELQARARGRAPSLAMPVRPAAGGPPTIRLEVGPPGCVLTGRVVDEQGRPLAQAVVAIQAAGGTPFDHGAPQVRASFLRSDAEGRFALDEAPPGQVLVTACVTAGDRAPATVSVTCGPVAAHAELMLAPGGGLEGEVRDPQGPVAEATVLAFVQQPDQALGYLQNLLGMRMAQADAQGRYRIAGLLPGSVQVRALRGGTDQVAQRTVTVTAGAVTACDLIAAAGGGPFTLRIQPPRPPVLLPAWMVVLQGVDAPDGGSPSVRMAGADGRVEYETLAQGRYQLSLYCRAGGTESVLLLQRELAVAGSEATVEVPKDRLLLQPVSGRIVDGARAPVAGAVVLLQGQDVPCTLQATTGDDGAFAFGAVPKGGYQLSVKPVGAAVAGLGLVQVVGDRPEQLGDRILP